MSNLNCRRLTTLQARDIWLAMFDLKCCEGQEKKEIVTHPSPMLLYQFLSYPQRTERRSVAWRVWERLRRRHVYACVVNFSCGYARHLCSVGLHVLAKHEWKCGTQLRLRSNQIRNSAWPLITGPFFCFSLKVQPSWPQNWKTTWFPWKSTITEIDRLPSVFSSVISLSIASCCNWRHWAPNGTSKRASI